MRYKRTKLPKKRSAGPKVIKVNDKDRARYVGDRFSAVRNHMVKAFRAYIKSPAWAILRINVIARDKECQNCGKPYKSKQRFTAHHKSYQHWGKGNHEEMEDVELLCCGCHSNADHSHTPFWAKRRPEVNYDSMVWERKTSEAVNKALESWDIFPT